jgi:hypothetical protein
MNKRLFFTFILSLMTLGLSFGQSDSLSLSFKEKHHNFGDVIQGDSVEYAFEFTNNTATAVLITNVYSTCGCTIPEWPKYPIVKGETRHIVVKYKSKDKMGIQNKSVIVLLSNPEKTYSTHQKLSIEVNVLPKP